MRLLCIAVSTIVIAAPAAHAGSGVDTAAEPVASGVAGSAWSAASDRELDARRGGLRLAQASIQSDLASAVSNNLVGDDSVTGAVTFDSGALSDVSGLFVSVLNTGNHVSMQSNVIFVVNP